jgi:hypothetical protein
MCADLLILLVVKMSLEIVYRRVHNYDFRRRIIDNKESNRYEQESICRVFWYSLQNGTGLGAGK